MEKSNQIINASEYKKRVISDLQDFLIYKKSTSLNYGSRLLEPFTVIETSENDKFIKANFENYNTKSGDYYWIDKKEFYDFLNGNKKAGISLKTDKEYTENGHIIFELRLSKNDIKNKTIYEVERLKNLTIEHTNGNLYKVFDVQVKLISNINVEDTVRLFVIEIESAEQFIKKQIVIKDNMEVTKGPGMSIVLNGSNTQEEFVKKGDAIKALKLERKNTLKEVSLWLQHQGALNAEEIKNKFNEKFN